MDARTPAVNTAAGRRAQRSLRLPADRKLRSVRLTDEDYAYACVRAANRHPQTSFSHYVEWLILRDRKGQTP